MKSVLSLNSILRFNLYSQTINSSESAAERKRTETFRSKLWVGLRTGSFVSMNKFSQKSLTALMCSNHLSSMFSLLYLFVSLCATNHQSLYFRVITAAYKGMVEGVNSVEVLQRAA